MKKTIDESKEETNSQPCHALNSTVNGLVPPHYLSPILNPQQALLRPIMTTAPPLYSPILPNAVQHSIPLHHHPIAGSQMTGDDSCRYISDIENICSNTDKATSSDKQCTPSVNQHFSKQNLNEISNNFPYQNNGEHSKCNFHEHRLIEEYLKMYGEDCSKFWQEAGLCSVGTQSPSTLKNDSTMATGSNYFNGKIDPSWNKTVPTAHENQTNMTNKENNIQLQSSVGNHINFENSSQRAIDYQSLSASQLASILPYFQHYPYQFQDERSEGKQNVQVNTSTCVQQNFDNTSCKKSAPCTFNAQESSSHHGNSKKCNENQSKINLNNSSVPNTSLALQPALVNHNINREINIQSKNNTDCNFHHAMHPIMNHGWNITNKSQHKSVAKNVPDNKKKLPKQLERQQICFICNSNLDANQQGCIDSLMTVPSKISVSDKISVILGYPLPRDAMNNIAICPKCYHLVNEVDVLEHRLNLCRKEVMFSLESSFERNGLPTNFYKKQQVQNNFGYLQHNEGQNLYSQGFVNHAQQIQYHVDQIGNIMSTFCGSQNNYNDQNGLHTGILQPSNTISNEHQIGLVQNENSINNFQGPTLQDTQALCAQQISSGNQPNNNSQNNTSIMQSSLINLQNMNMSSITHHNAHNHSHHSESVQNQQTNAINYSNCKQFVQHKNIDNIQPGYSHVLSEEHLPQSVTEKNERVAQNLTHKPALSSVENIHINYQCVPKNTNDMTKNIVSSEEIVTHNYEDKLSRRNICGSENAAQAMRTSTDVSSNLIHSVGNNNQQRNLYEENNECHNILNKPSDLSTNPNQNRFSNRGTTYSNCHHTNQSVNICATQSSQTLNSSDNLSASLVNHGANSTINLCASNENNFHGKQNSLSNGIYYDCNEQKIPLSQIQTYNDPNFNNINFEMCTPHKNNSHENNIQRQQNLSIETSNEGGNCEVSNKLIPHFSSDTGTAQQILNLMPAEKRDNASWPVENTALPTNYHTNTIESSHLEIPSSTKANNNEQRIDDKSDKNLCRNKYNSQSDERSFQNNFTITHNYQSIQNIKPLNDIDKRSNKFKNSHSTVIMANASDNSCTTQNSLESLKITSKNTLVEFDKEEKIKDKNTGKIDNLSSNSIIADLPQDASHNMLQESFATIVPTYGDASRNFDESEHIFDTLSQYDEDVNIEDITSKSVDEKCNKNLCLESSDEAWTSSSFITQEPSASNSKNGMVEGDVDIEECDNLIDHITDNSSENSNDFTEDDLLSIENNSPTNAFHTVEEISEDHTLIEPSIHPSRDAESFERIASPLNPLTPTLPPEGIRNVQDATEYHKPTLLGKSIKIKKHAKLQICRQCDQVFSNRQALIKHIKRRHKYYSPHVCTECNRKFTSEKMLASHMVCHKKYHCGTCGEVFSKKTKLKMHTSTAHSKEHHTCNICNKVILSLQALISHSKTHTKKVPVCDICHKEFASNKNLKDHSLIHSGELPYKCNNCNRNFRYRSNMFSHNKICSGVSLYNCDFCEKKFPLEHLYKRHILEHKGVYSHQCSICDKGFGKSSNLRNHFSTHSEHSVIYRCQICMSNKNSACNLNTSKVIPGTICPICGKVIKRKDAMTDHLSQHEGKRNHVCAQCSASFIYRPNLKNHIKIVHENKKPYICAVCSKTFARNDNYKSHLRTHTGEKPYTCHCGKSFSYSCNFNRHKKRHKEETKEE